MLLGRGRLGRVGCLGKFFLVQVMGGELGVVWDEC